MAPGYKDLEKYFASIHNVNLAHGTAFQAMKSLNNKIKIGCSFNMAPCIPATKSSEEIFMQLNYLILIGIDHLLTLCILESIQNY